MTTKAPTRAARDKTGQKLDAEFERTRRARLEEARREVAQEIQERSRARSDTGLIATLLTLASRDEVKIQRASDRYSSTKSWAMACQTKAAVRGGMAGAFPLFGLTVSGSTRGNVLLFSSVFRMVLGIGYVVGRKNQVNDNFVTPVPDGIAIICHYMTNKKKPKLAGLDQICKSPNVGYIFDAHTPPASTFASAVASRAIGEAVELEPLVGRMRDGEDVSIHPGLTSILSSFEAKLLAMNAGTTVAALLPIVGSTVGGLLGVGIVRAAGSAAEKYFAAKIQVK